jgi:ABC-type antimicrobial peptide transport system permease subunit
VIGDNLWRGRFGRDPKLVGRTISLEQQPCKVIGVLAPGFGGSSFSGNPAADVWLPLQADPSSADHASRVRVTARLKPGIKLENAQNDVGATMKPFLQKYPPQSASEAPLLFLEGFTAIPLREAVVGDVRPALYLLTSAVGFVLLISCANVASLTLARAGRRTREIAIRAALGAQPKEIARALLAESVVISLFGGGFRSRVGISRSARAAGRQSERYPPTRRKRFGDRHGLARLSFHSGYLSINCHSVRADSRARRFTQ